MGESLTIFSSQEKKHRSFAANFSDWAVNQLPSEAREATIQTIAPSNPYERAWYIATEKAKADRQHILAAVKIVSALRGDSLTDTIASLNDHIYGVWTDAIQVVRKVDEAGQPIVKTLEKPLSVVTWLADDENGALAHSGAEAEMIVAVSIIDFSDPAAIPRTILLSTKTRMKAFNRDQVETWVAQGNATSVTESAGGFSLPNGGREFYDQTQPLTVSIMTSPEAEPIEILHMDTWQDMPNDTLRTFTYGSLRDVLEVFLSEQEITVASMQDLFNLPAQVNLPIREASVMI